jgi:hypothetical protein
MLNNPKPSYAREVSLGVYKEVPPSRVFALAVRRGTTGIRGGFLKALVEPPGMASRRARERSPGRIMLLNDSEKAVDSFIWSRAGWVARIGQTAPVDSPESLGGMSMRGAGAAE